MDSSAKAPAEQSSDTNASAQTPPQAPEDDENALETPEGASSDSSTIDTTADSNSESSGASSAPGAPSPKKGGSGLKGFLKKFNLYLLLFVFILIAAGGIIMISYFQSHKVNATTVKDQTLSQSALAQVADSDATVGQPKQVLNIESNAVFAGQVLIRDGLQVAGNIQVGGTVTLQNLDVSGQVTFNQTQVTKGLTVGGSLGIQGPATIGQSLQVNGSGTFTGAVSAPQVTTSNLQLNGNLTLDNHLLTGGATPVHSSGPAVGSGGTTSMSGTDTSGSVTINTGSGAAAGCFISISFTSPYQTTPNVMITPVGASGGGIAYYVNRSTTGFSICDASVPPAEANFGFDYFVVG